MTIRSRPRQERAARSGVHGFILLGRSAARSAAKFGVGVRAMPRTICDLGDAHIRLQAPDHWMQVEARGSRVILSDAGCSTPIFLEPLPTVEAVDTWIAALVTRKSRLHGHQECSKPDARRFVLTITSREGTVERAYQLQRVPSSRSMLVWVAASIDLDGEAS